VFDFVFQQKGMVLPLSDDFGISMMGAPNKISPDKRHHRRSILTLCHQLGKLKHFKIVKIKWMGAVGSADIIFPIVCIISGVYQIYQHEWHRISREYGFLQ
jgi:hypothetical protein